VNNQCFGAASYRANRNAQTTQAINRQTSAPIIAALKILHYAVAV
jgi:hypothetical protein